VKQPEAILVAGTGNLASHIVSQLSAIAGFKVFVKGTSADKTEAFIHKYGGSVFIPNTVANAGLPVLLCVPDSEIRQAAEQHLEFASCMIHCSGSTDIQALESYTDSAAVLWPVQTFTTGRAVSWKTIPICIESTNQISNEAVTALGNLLGGPLVSLSSVQRQKLHLSAVVVNNFTNQLATLAESYCRQNNLDFQLLLPLLSETAAKLESLTPEQAQTGPARRGDRVTIQKHLQLLQEQGNLKDVYQFMSDQIEQQYLVRK
jgi:predicted short-subunit dehydrogenase-like oxidoreductase (DUF2520 family)